MTPKAKISFCDEAEKDHQVGYLLRWWAEDTDDWNYVLNVIRACPTAMRYYVRARKLWWIDARLITYLAPLFSNAASYFADIKEQPSEATTLRQEVERLQQENAALRKKLIEAATQRNVTRMPQTLSQAFGELYLQNGAPLSVIKASYRALSRTIAAPSS